MSGYIIINMPEPKCKRDYDYERNNIGYDEQYPEGGIKCKNFINCGCILPDWWFDCKGKYLCTCCDMTEWVLSVVNSE